MAGAQDYGLFIGRYDGYYPNATPVGVSVNSTNYSNITNACITSGKVSFELTTRTLTLENATINGTIHSYGDITINLIGDNYINSVDSSAIISDITSNAPNIKFKGAGRLLATPYSNECIAGFNAPSYEDGQTLLLGNLYYFSVIGTQLFDGGSDHISTAADLKKLAAYVNNGYITSGTITLDNDINCSTLGTMEPIGKSTNPFTASFYGNNKTISNLTVSSTGEAGLFGVIQNGSVSNLNLSNCTITGGNYAGAVAGKGPGAGNITQVHVKGTTTVTATTPGAIVGHFDSGTLTYAYYDYTVTTTITGGGTSSEYTPRAIGEEGNGGAGGDNATQDRVLYTKLLTASPATYGTLDTYYITQNNYTDNNKFAPGQTAYVKATPESGFEVLDVSVTYTENSIPKIITPVLDTQKSGNGVFYFSFTMPDAAATATVTFVSSSGIIVAGHAAPAAGGAITGTGITGTVSFTPATTTTPNILTLNEATITGQIISNVGDLTIFLTEISKIQAAGSETSLILSTNNGELSFDTNPAATGSLEFKDDTGNAIFAGEPISGFTSKAYLNGIDYNATDKTIGLTLYDVWVNGVKINSASKTDVMGDGKITYDSDNRILTLKDGTTIPDYGISVDPSSDLTVVLDGTINVTGSTYAFNTNGDKINFVKATEDTSVNLTAKCGLGHHPISFDFITLGSGLYWKPIDSQTTVITTDPKFVIVGDYVITDQPVTSSGTITYDSTNKVLTIDGFALTDNSNLNNDPVPPTYIKSGVVGLTVKLKGNSEINYSRNDYIFEAIGTGATILFDGTEGGKLDMQINSNSQPFGGFAEIKYNKLAYWNTTGNNHTIQAPTAPEMAPNANNEVELTKPYADGSIKYSIVYADGTAGVSDATYSAPFAMAAPGTVTAWVEANDVTTSTVKGKYFGYKDAPFTMLANETKTPELIPAIETGDYIGYATASTPYSSSEPGVATFDGTITAVAFGNTTLTTKMAYSGQTANVVILNYNNQFETVVKVGREFTNYVNFAPGQSYATFCNTDAEDWTLPDGITVYGVRIPNSGNEVELSEIKFIPGNSTGYFTVLLKRDDTSKTSFGTVTKYTRKATDNLPVNHLHFTSDPQGLTTNGKQYILYKDEFVKATGKIIGPVGYLENTTTNPARGFVIEGGGDGSTAIDDTLINNEEETGNGEWYDLQGRRIAKPTKAGLYIVNGKKVVINNK